ncbi:hypothetical protein NADFUDRAFT_50137 [Nadsonia fulvescens var. elongata DSM 6958]|uniref:Transmembrane protein 135 N-terminal domain-containing protein n=1 Tax=Nadsonia fulvescens var. elongata DSM 6958 TaxID=857566 RepID=A0A1E3PL98_9ASCO|nr:hypothetical protein NADFUDRAFT_50137 [Nadsonia fulvescens var. elongata DSM 6958]
MTSWFYYPEKLPQSYHKWITMASTTDEKLVHLLREIHFGRLLFNRVPENQANIETLRSLYEKFQISYPDPLLFKSQPEHEHESAPVNNSGTVMPYVNCRLVHRNVTSNCEIHALWRLVTGFEYAFMIYLPLNCVLSLKTIIPLIQNRKSGKSPLTARNLFQFLKPILISSTRSSVFLSSFIVIIYYTICVSRNYLPLILKGIYLLNEKSPKDHDYHHDELSWRTRFDKYSPIAGSIFCGLSIFLEPQRKQGELALFVFMKGIYCLLIRERENNTTTDENKGLNYKKKSYYVFPSKNVESLVFSLSFSTLLVLYQRDKALVRGVFNKLIGLCV